MGSRRDADSYWDEFDPPWYNPEPETMGRARRPFSTMQGWEERPRAWTEEPDLYTPRQSQSRRQERYREPEPEPYRVIRSQPLEFDNDRYGPTGYYGSSRYRQSSRSGAAEPRHYRGEREMDDREMRRIEREREEIARARREQEAERERRRREYEYDRGRGGRDRYYFGGGGGYGGGGSSGGSSGSGWRRRASRWWDSAFDAAMDGVEEWMEWMEWRSGWSRGKNNFPVTLMIDGA